MKIKRYLHKYIGIVLIIFGVLFNQWTISKLFTENGRIDNNKLIVLIWITNILLVLAGVCSALFWQAISKNNLFKKAVKTLKTVFVIGLITLILYFVIDNVFGLIYPIKPWEKELSIMSSVSYIDEPYYTKDFMWEQANSSKRKYWDAPSNTRLVFKKTFKGRYINTQPLSVGFKKVYRKTVNQYSADEPSVKKVLMIGGSTLYCLEVPDELTVSSILAKKLNSSNQGKYFVINSGVESDTSIQELERLKQELNAGLRPDIVIAYHGFNEINAGVYLDDPKATMWEKIIRVGYKDRIYGFLSGSFIEGNIYERVRLEADKKKTVIRTIPPTMMNETRIREASQKAKDTFVKNNIEMYELSKKYNFKYHSILQPVAAYGKYSEQHSDINIVRAWANKNEPKIFSAFEIGYPILKDSIKQLEKVGISSYDKTDLFLSKDKNIFTDTCHVNSIGNLMVSDSISEIILKNNQISYETR